MPLRWKPTSGELYCFCLLLNLSLSLHQCEFPRISFQVDGTRAKQSADGLSEALLIRTDTWLSLLPSSGRRGKARLIRIETRLSFFLLSFSGCSNASAFCKLLGPPRPSDHSAGTLTHIAATKVAPDPPPELWDGVRVVPCRNLASRHKFRTH